MLVRDLTRISSTARFRSSGKWRSPVELCNFSPANLDARGGFDADPDLASPNIDYGDLDSGFDENAFADFAIEYEHWFLPEFLRDCKLPIDLNLNRFEREVGSITG
jgi:hypothetical protein